MSTEDLTGCTVTEVHAAVMRAKTMAMNRDIALSC